MDGHDIPGAAGDGRDKGPERMTQEQWLEHRKKVGEANARSYGAKDEAQGTVEQRLELWRSRGAASARKYGVRVCRRQGAPV